MATIRAIASGNWSATSTWNGGVLPGNGDTVYSNGFSVVIDQNISIGGDNNPIVNAGSFVSGQWYQITSVGTTNFTGIGASANTVGIVFLATGAGSGTGQARARATLTNLNNASAGAAAGGGFTMSSSWGITTDLRPGTSNLLAVTGGSFTLSNANIGGSTSNIIVVNNTGSGTITFDACNIALVVSGQGTMAANSGSGSLRFINGSNLILDSSSGTIGALNSSSTGSIICDLISIRGSQWARAISSTNTGSVVVSNSIITGGTSQTGIANTSAGSIQITNSTINAGGGTEAVQNTSTGSVICSNCTFTAISSTAAISSTNVNATNRFSGTFISSTNGTQPINAPRWILNSIPTASYIQHALDGINANSFVRYFTADNSLGQANPTDVRSGVTYASGNLTGRLTIPARGTVANGVTVGPNMPFTATRSGTTATATLTYSYPYSVGDVITVTGASNNEWNMDYTIASVISGTSVTFTVPTTHSATAGTGANMQTKGTAVLDGASVAAAVWGAASRTITGGTVDTLTNAPSVPSAAAIASQVRTELGTELGRIDAAVSSRATPANIPTSDITAIKAKTDALNTSRLGNVSTVESTGAALAAALTAP